MFVFPPPVRWPIVLRLIPMGVGFFVGAFLDQWLADRQTRRRR